MGVQKGICVGRTVEECYVQPDMVHGGYGVRLVRISDTSQREEYCCALGLEYDVVEELALYLYAVHATPEDAAELIEDWLYDHDATAPAASRI